MGRFVVRMFGTEGTAKSWSQKKPIIVMSRKKVSVGGTGEEELPGGRWEVKSGQKPA